ncbi:MAG: PEP-CTERM sorting domain-containing protein [Candidatus Solibacter sp.]|nr:PEP-CTERM sorting domain-containing protein [Candidatus Solibacter sp.]
MKTLLFTAFAVILLSATPVLADNFQLNDWVFNVSGTFYNPAPNPNPLSSEFDASAFNFTTGLGPIQLTLGPGSYSVIGYFDHDIVGLNNGVANETGSVHGIAAAGQSWEIDDPGYGNMPPYVGNLVDNVVAGSLDNQLFDGTYTGPDDVAMALGWAFIVNSGETAHLRFDITSTAAPSGFYLQQTDPGGLDLYFSSSLDITGQTDVPEPGAWILLATVAGLLSLGKLKRTAS